MAPSAGATDYLYHHVVLPPKLPQKDDRDAAHERCLFEMVIQALEYLMGIVDESYIATMTSAVAMIKNLRDNRDDHGDVSEVQLETLLSNLSAVETHSPVPLEIKAQNACILISRQKRHLNFEFFELSPTNEAALRSTRLMRTFPGYASRISVDQMSNASLQSSIAGTIAKMATQSAPGFQPQVRKNGKDEDEDRDTTAPGLVSDFLMTVFATIGEATDVKRIIKATREDVLWNDCKQPWRRSPLWLLIRVVLQLWFTRNANSLKSPDKIYKAFMICMLRRLLDSARINWKALGNETIHNISAKLIRRLRKFELLKQSDCLLPFWTESIKDCLLNSHTVITQNWQGHAHNTDVNIDTTVVKNIHPKNDLDMKLPALDTFLSGMRARQHDRPCSTFSPSSVFPSFPAAMLPENVHGSNEYKYFHLAALEAWVDQQLRTWTSLHLNDTATCGELRRLIEHYFTTATAAYAGIPISISIMYLTLAELWIACDRSACAQYSLLREYDPELCITEFQCLVLPQKQHMKRLHEIECYIQSRREAAASQLPSVYRLFGHQSSFAVRYFEESRELQATLAEIERDAEKKRTQKCQELRKRKTEYDTLMTQYKLRYRDLRLQPPLWIHENSASELATIFELRVPQAFSDWRDTSAYMISEVLRHRDREAEKPYCSYTLQQHQDLSRMLSSLYYRRRIVPSSNVKPYNVTHRKHKKAIPHLTEEDVCLPNALQYAYFDTSLGVLNTAAPTCTEDVPKLCMYHVPQRSKVLDRFMYRPPSAPDGTPPNEVIASLSDCPAHYSIEEYKAFGTISFGSQIIYSNILAQLATSTTDFTKVETQCLILQTIQQVGMPSKDVERINHAVVLDKCFGHAMLEQLEIALGRVSENWESWRASDSFSLLARRMLSLTQSPEVRTRALSYLVELRSVCFKWLQRLKIRVAACTDDEQRDELHSRATEIALLCASTCDVETADLELVLQQDSAISVLLQSSIVIQENWASVRSEHQALYDSLLQSHRAMMYRAFKVLRTLILQDSTGLCDAVTANWAVFDPNTASGWCSLEQPRHHWLAINSGTLLVHFNLLTAELLVDGLPLARLPSKFMQHEMYRPLFSKSTLEVIPTNEPGLEFSARYVYHYYKLHFGMQGPDMLVVAVQGNSRLDLIPSRVFQGRLPYAFVADFIHWYDHTNHEVVFRPRQSPWITDIECWRLKHDVRTRHWQLVKGPNALVNLTSTSARVLSRIVLSMEEAQHIHVVLNTTTQTVDVKLPRLQLGFFVERQSDAIYSRQFRGKIIDTQQNIGTLTGLTSKLVLKKDQSERMLLIPVPRNFGISSIKYAKVSSSDHVTVEISKDDATKVYAYNIDEDIGRITDSGDLESKLLISYLHAVTSSCLPDRLTKMTGTEAALQILQSAAVRSFDLLTRRNVELLEQIATLSTRRSFYPAHLKVMQQVSWNKSLPALSQHPQFRASVEKIFDYAEKMQIFFPTHAVFTDIRDARKRLSSDSTLDRRNLIRTTTLHSTGFSAELLTVLPDEKYIARDTQRRSGRSERATIAATLVLRNKFALHKSIPNFKDILLRAHFSNNTIKGVEGSLVLSDLRYDSKLLGDPSTYLNKTWCSLHHCLVAANSDVNVFNIMIWLSTMAYAESADMNVVQALAALYKDPEYATIHLPSAPTFKLAAGSTWRPAEIQSIVQRKLLSFDDSAESRLAKRDSETEQEHISRIEGLFDSNQNAAIQSFVVALQRQWPVRRPSTPTPTNISKYLKVASAMEDITMKCEDWYDNREFSRYLDQVSKLCARQAVSPINQPHYPLSMPINKEALNNRRRKLTSEEVFAAAPPYIFRQCLGDETMSDQLAMPCEPTISFAAHTLPSNGSNMRDRLEALCCSLQKHASSRTEKDYVEQLRASTAALNEHPSDNVPHIAASVKALLQKYLCDCKTFLGDLNYALAGCVRDSGLFSDRIGLRTDHSMRLSPQFWLHQLHRDRFELLSNIWKPVIIKYGVAITHLHRATRLVELSDKPVDLYEELRHVGHSNWDPLQFPETLLLEAESCIMVRKEQESIASHMRLPKNGVNTVLQLLMGGGKSSTIVPILAAHLTDKDKLVRIIVAKAQSQQMFQMLVSKLGGLLNRRIYHMPFSRKLRLSPANAENVRKIYEECVQNRGVLLVQPEHILSFKLMAIDSVLTDEPELARSMLATQAYFDNVTRDIIDEVDENLSVKFELVYTMGSQESIDFAPERWLIIQQVLALLPRFAIQIQKHLPEAIDIQDFGDGKFPRVRLLRKDAADEFLESLAHHIVNRGLFSLPTRSQSDEMRVAILRYITQPQLDIEDINAVEESKFWSESTKLPLLLVRGLIAGGVLQFTLSNKRWRVNYGLDPTRTPSTALAVPYRSKDSPSPRSEFSHSDVVLILTLLSQYYGGLSDEQLFDTLNHVLSSDQHDIYYDEIVHTASSSLPAAFRQLAGISIRDRHQCITELFPALRYSKNAIDYYFTHLVFPKQCKQFPQKLSASGWDLGASKTHPTTGFSGTIDTLHLLPLDIKHLDLPSQSYTNAQVLAYLLKDETLVELLPPRTNDAPSDGEHLLNIVQGLQADVRVILDCGASILELNNQEVAKAWLRMRDSDVEAVVYFEDERLSVLDRTGHIESFQTSPYAKQLDSCIVYLDESHTRGTDLKLPRDYRAVVTLGAQLTKDRLTQACMRLRKLGHGQSVTFMVPEEIATKIRELTAKAVGELIRVNDVICWSISETWQDLRRSMPLWAVQGRRFENHRYLLNGIKTTKSQAKAFLEDEAQGLETRYQPRTDNGSSQLVGWDVSNRNIALIVSRCRDFEAMGFGSAALSEEQERELAPEIEEERQVERPPKMQAETHVLHPDLMWLVHHGRIKPSSTTFESAFKALRYTSPAKLFNLEQQSSFPTDLLVTADFMRTVKIPSSSSRAAFTSDSYQRPVQFIVTTSNPNHAETTQHAIVISPFEANRLQPIIRRTMKVTLHLFAPRSNSGFASLDQLLLYNVGRVFTYNSISRSLTTQLNIFSGSLYLRSLTEYDELCDFLGLLRTSKVKPGQQVYADGFIEPPAGTWGLKQSPVPFLRALLMKIRREGEGVEKTHMGKLMNGVRLEEGDFRTA
ncbi:Nn.00g074860.m01.CDS01 [Neocucurbitaria sp. VM-36]